MYGMAKITSKGGKKASSSGKWAKRSPASGKFVIGRTAFASISSVEGIRLSKRMSGDLRRTAGMSADERRATLASKYGKR